MYAVDVAEISSAYIKKGGFYMFKNGKEFMEYLHENYGFLEAYRMAKEYLLVSRESNTDPDEVQFCNELEVEMNKLDMI